MSKVKRELEYMVQASPKLIYNCLSTAAGLASWFCEDANVKNDVYNFVWEGSTEQAKILAKKKDEYVRFKWLNTMNDDSYFELRIRIDDMTGELAIIVTDFCEEGEDEDLELLWNSLIDEMRHALGS